MSYADAQRRKYALLSWMLRTGPSDDPKRMPNPERLYGKGPLRWSILKLEDTYKPYVTNGAVLFPGLYDRIEKAAKENLTYRDEQDLLGQLYEFGERDNAPDWMPKSTMGYIQAGSVLAVMNSATKDAHEMSFPNGMDVSAFSKRKGSLESFGR